MTLNLLPVSLGETARSDLLERRLRRYHPRFQGKVRSLATRHTRIGDLAVSFPALLFALAVPRPRFDPAPALARVIAGFALAEIAATADVPMWLRKLPPEAFTRPIPRLPDGELFRRRIANHLPRSPRFSSTWLQAVADLAEFGHESAAMWVARELVRDPRRVKPVRLRLIGLWTWFSGQPATFGHTLIDRPWTPNMGMDQAIAAAKAWSELIELHLDLGPRPISDMWLQPGRVAGYEFLPLDSIAAITEEAAAMKNCVRTYGATLAGNYARLWSVRWDGAHVATLRLASRYGDPLLSIVELKGPGNAKAPRELWWAARRWLHMHDLLELDTKPRDWNTVRPDRAIWLSLWRPYWLAKRRIPEWLPIAPSRGALRVL